MNEYPVPLGGEFEVSSLLLLPVGTREKLNSSTMIPAPSLFEPRLGDKYWEGSAGRRLSLAPQR